MLRDSYRTQCGGCLVIPAGTRDHLCAHPEVVGYLDEVAGLVTLPTDSRFLAIEVELGRVIGRSGCAETAPIKPSETAVFAQRVGRPKASRVVVGAPGPETSVVSILAFAGDEAGTYVLITSFVGPVGKKEPWDGSISPGSEEAVEALDFWCRHALVHDPAVMGEPFESTWVGVMNS